MKEAGLFWLPLMDAIDVVPVVNRRVRWLDRGKFVLMTGARFVLGTALLFYGLSKVFAFQFQVTPWAYAKALGKAGGAWLLWATLGYAPWFQRLLGWLEVLPAVMLLWSRTRRLGALLAFPVVANVVLFNFAMDLWPDTKLISLLLLALTVFLVLYDLPIYLTFLRGLLAPSVPETKGRLHRVGDVVGTVVPVLIVAGCVAAALTHDAYHDGPDGGFPWASADQRCGNMAS